MKLLFPSFHDLVGFNIFFLPPARELWCLKVGMGEFRNAGEKKLRTTWMPEMEFRPQMAKNCAQNGLADIINLQDVRVAGSTADLDHFGSEVLLVGDF